MYLLLQLKKQMESDLKTLPLDMSEKIISQSKVNQNKDLDSSVNLQSSITNLNKLIRTVKETDVLQSSKKVDPLSPLASPKKDAAKVAKKATRMVASANVHCHSPLGVCRKKASVKSVINTK